MIRSFKMNTNKWVIVLLSLALAAACLFNPVLQSNRASAATAGVDIIHVGPGRQYTMLGQVPWPLLGPGDKVYIHWQETPYRELILLSSKGTAAAPIEVHGVSDGPNGEKPIIDANGGYYSLYSLFLGPQFARGPINVQRSGGRLETYRPSHIWIDNLEVRGGLWNNPLSWYYGTTGTMDSKSAGITIEGGEHIRITNCTVTNNGNGIYVNSEVVPYGDGRFYPSRDITIESNTIVGNGVVGSSEHHNVNATAYGLTVQNNTTGPLRPGALGSDIVANSLD
ncbi:right-handed parallel beta-helix repeat-containing protein [Cohnella panacarvi]|uniref:right-handed parallel beta-helix repeat-containing protein n=1 Tax=Cohnella panacarvi TaxID=400776 RepID=UPI00047C6CE4|nr:DUF1565 domain-containing protein [Cohnella panacarvi]